MKENSCQGCCKNGGCVKALSEKFGLRPIWIRVLIVILIIFLIKKAIIESSFLMYIYCLHPAFESIKAIKQGLTPEIGKPLFSFWVCLVLFSLLSMLLPIHISECPFSFLIKLAFVIFLHCCNCKYSVKIMDGLVMPFLSKHEVWIENAHKHMHECCEKKMDKCCPYIKSLIHGVHPEEAALLEKAPEKK